MGEPFKLNVTLAGNAFSAEGPEESVREQYGLWLEALSSLKAASPSPTSPLPAPPYETPGGLSKRVSDQVLDRVFSVDHSKKRLSLLLLPKGDKREADALLLLLYGFSVFFEEHSVLGGRLLEAARTSGLMLERVDRPLEPHADKLLPGGYRRGKTYGLNNPGKAYAEEMLTKILEG